MAGNPIKISGAIITFNEERNIERCLKSLQGICDEIVVVDSFSTDGTKAICEKYNVRFIENEFKGHIEQKNFALAKASNPYVLSLDADEALSEKLRTEISSIKKDCRQKAYKFNRFTNYCGQWIKHSGWYPDTKVRLWDKSVGQWGGLNPHDEVELAGGIAAKLVKGDLLHYSYYSISEHIERSIKYAKISAFAMQKRGKQATFSKLFINPSFRFIQDYVLRRGFLDGFYGLIICATSSFTTFLKYVYLRSLNSGKPIE